LELAKGRNIQLDDHIIGSYAVAVIVNPANPIGSMTKDQVRDLFTGAARNWKDVGGSDSAVHLYIRDPVSGTFLGFRELAMENKAYGSGPTALTNYSQIAEAVSRDPVGIGYIGFDQLAASGVKAVSIQNIAPEAAAVNQNKYPFARVLHLYTNKAGTSAEAADFIKFVQSSAGKQILAQAGFVPAP
jgi:phosphate transport system substrate-binding protein